MLVFGEPYDTGKDAVIVIVSRKGWLHRSERAVGIYTIRADGTTWTPALDSSLHALIGVCTGFAAAVIGTLAVLRRPPWPDLTDRAVTGLARAKLADRSRHA